MSQPNLFYDYSKRDYLLPAGCKNLVDVLNHSKGLDTKLRRLMAKDPNKGLLRQVTIAGQVTVKELARLLGLKAFKVLGCLMVDFKMFKQLDEVIDFDLAARIALQFGFLATRVP